MERCRVSTEERDSLVRCVLCGQGVKKGPEVVNHSTGDEGRACWACLRRSRRCVNSGPK